MSPARRPPPREEIVHPGACRCPTCSGNYAEDQGRPNRDAGYVRGFVTFVRPFSCRIYETWCKRRAKSSDRPWVRGPGLSAHIIVSNFAGDYCWARRGRPRGEAWG
jgi:hypothetical protein